MKKFFSCFLLLVTLFIAGCDFDSLIDDRYRQAKKHILSNLNDPDSYEMEYCKYNKKFKDTYKIKFRAKNGFGAKRIYFAYAFFTPDGTLRNVYVFSEEREQFEFLVKEE